MLAHPRLKSLASGVVVLGLVGVAQAAIPATANATTPLPSVARAYGAPPTVTIVINAGGNTITITVGGNANGSATVTISGRNFTVQVVNGVANFRFPANLPIGSYPFSVRFNGPGGVATVTTQTLFVTRFGNAVGVEAYRALLRAHGVGVNRGGNGVSGLDSGSAGATGTGTGSSGSGTGSASGSGSSSGSLANTGASTQTELLGLLGVGLLVAGGSSIVIARRRVRV
jgi:LPXTG-motif cell wall-anchored protein